VGDLQPSSTLLDTPRRMPMGRAAGRGRRWTGGQEWVWWEACGGGGPEEGREGALWWQLVMRGRVGEE
jgi:hypothetical protein